MGVPVCLEFQARSKAKGDLQKITAELDQIEQRLHANLACAIAALGAERIRLQKGRWPESLEEIVQAGCLKKVPIDAFDGNPSRFRRTKNGLVIYSIGPEGSYDGKSPGRFAGIQRKGCPD